MVSTKDEVLEPSTATLAGMRLAQAPPGEEICITGSAGMFPDSDNVYQFRDNLMSKYDMVTEDDRRWTVDHPEIPARSGKLNNIEKFDAAFFGVHYKQGHSMDPMCRVLLEKSCEAILDAGINPAELRGTSTGVFIGSCFSESEKVWFYEKLQPYGFSITGCSRALLSNRVSYWLGVNGPSYTVDSACSSSLYAIDHAYKAIREGECDQAIVGGSNLCLQPYLSLQFNRLGVLSPQGMCKCFDAEANGYARSEAVVVVFLQKTRDARRIYATIVHAKTNCDGYKEQGITYPSGVMQQQLLEQFYEECRLDPRSLSWIEAHGTGTRVGDPEELNALDTVFCKGRATPLPIGSVKSNIGHSEPASGLCSVTKVIIAMETGLIPPNLHYNSPREGVPALANGTLQVVTEPQPWDGGLVGINSFGFGGANAHVLLRWNSKEKVNGGAPDDGIPRLVAISSRTEHGARQILDDLESRPVDAEYVGLYHSIHALRIQGHLYRGFTLLGLDTPVNKVQYFDGAPRPVWFVFSGLGSGWRGMGTSLLTLPAFAAAVDKCQSVLAPLGLDLRDILRNDTLDDVVHCFVGVTAVQIGLVCVLESVGIRGEGIVSHSIGDLAAGFADNCLTAEQAVLGAYFRARTLVKAGCAHGAMAHVDTSAECVQPLLSPDVEVICDDWGNSCVVAGSAEAIDAVVTQLASRGVKSVKLCCNKVAIHSQHIAIARKMLVQYLQKVAPSPRTRSERWHVSTDHPSRLVSAEFLADSLIGRVAFSQPAKLIPSCAVIIEISADDRLSRTHEADRNQRLVVPLMRKGADGLQSTLTAIGQLFLAGLEPQLSALYPAVDYPVSRGTPMISPLVDWEHSQDWYVCRYKANVISNRNERVFTINPAHDDMEFYRGHVIDGRNLFPATGYIVLVWETFAMMCDRSIIETHVVFENIRFHRATNLPKDGAVDFLVMVQKGSGNFEVVEGGAAIVTGTITAGDEEDFETDIEEPQEDADAIIMSGRDVYKELRLRGYNYSGLFKSIVSTNVQGTRGRIRWAHNWVAFMDNMLQTQILNQDTRGLFVPTAILRLVINPSFHLTLVKQLEGPQDINVDKPTENTVDMDVTMNREKGVIRSGGVEIRGLNASAITRRKPLGEPVVEKYQFVPNTNERPITDTCMDLSEVLRVCIHVGLENYFGIKVKVVELADSAATKPLLAPTVAAILGDLPLIQANVTVLAAVDNALVSDLGPGITVDDRKLRDEQDSLFVIASNVFARVEVMQVAITIIASEGFVLAREACEQPTNLVPGIQVVNEYSLGDEKIVLFKKSVETPDTLVIPVLEGSTEWVAQLQEALSREKSTQRLLLVAQNDPLSGILGLFNCIRKEPGGELARCYFITDSAAPRFDPKLPIYHDQIAKDMAVNVFHDGRWGSYRHLALGKAMPISVQHTYTCTSIRGDLSSFNWVQGPLKLDTFQPKPHQELVQVYVSALNFRDVMTATGKLAIEVIAKTRFEQECTQGLEFAGRDMNGRRVMGQIAAGAMATMVVADSDLLWEIPDHWSMEEAATVPVVYGTAYYALVKSGRMARGDTVLIHAGSGGVGQAAIYLALHTGCTVFTTVGTQEKRDFIKKTFPQLTDRHIGNSRDTSFEHLVMSETNGRGVDLVLNSLAEEKLQASVRCLAVGGRFLEIGKFDLANNNPLGMEMFLKETSFHGIMLDKLFSAPSSWKKVLYDLLLQGILDGAVKPLCRTVFAEKEVEQAFRYMAAGKHIGKVLLSIRPEEKELTLVPEIFMMKATPKFYCNPNYSYIIAGGLGGFGLELADWMVLRGARKLVLTSRTGLRTGYQCARVDLWRSYGVVVEINTDDISTEEGVTSLLNQANDMGPVAAIFNLAVILLDALFTNQTADAFIRSAAPKALATHHLDSISRRLCPHLTHFVVFSSVSCGRGNAGQTNYGMSNSVMERICERRVKDGFPGLAVQWGAVGEVGLVADMQEEQLELVIGGTLQQRILSCLEVLDGLLCQSHPVVASMVVAEKRASASGAGGLVDCVVNILGLRDLKTVSLHSSLAVLGMDSMMAVEIKQTLEREFEVFLTPQDIRDLTFAKLIELASSDVATTKTKSTTTSGELDMGGLEFMIRAIGDESAAQHLTTVLPSLVQEPCVDPLVFMVPGIEGMASVLEPLARNIAAHVVGIQLGNEAVNNESTRSMAQSILPCVKSKLKAGAAFNLVGYSFGGSVVLHLALLLEQDGFAPGQVILLDGAPQFLQEVCRRQSTDGTEDNLQINLLTLILSLMKKLDAASVAEIRSNMLKLPLWSERVELFLTYAPESGLYSYEYLKFSTNACLKRVQSINSFDWPADAKLKSKITFIRPNYLDAPASSDQGVSKFSVHPVDLHFAKGNHITILESLNVASVINNQIMKT